MAGAKNGNSDSGKNWKGSSQEAATDHIRHRWQMTSVEQERTKRDRSWQRLLIKSAAIVGAGCLLYFGYLFWVMRLPTRTPMLAVSVAFYPEEFPPNLYAEEDLRALSYLDGKNISLFQQSSFSLTQFEKGLKQLGEEVNGGTVLIVLNAHGAVNDAGEPCLIPADASPRQPENWVSLKSVLNKIAEQEFVKKNPVVVFLDCQHQKFEPRMGILENQFFHVLETNELIENLKDVRLALVASASSGESTHYMHSEQMSVFGYYLQVALSGEADLAKHGNGDSKLTLAECHKYLRDKVNEWTEWNLGASQTVSLKYTNNFVNPESVMLAYTLREPIPQSARNSESISPEDRQALWERYHSLDLSNLRRFIPEQLSDLEERLLRLDQWSTAGIAYREPVRTLATQLSQDLDRFEQTSLAEWLSPVPIEVHSLPLAKQLNHRLASDLAEWEQALKAENPTRQSLSALRDQWKDRVDEFRPAEYHFLELLLSDAPDAIWTQSGLLHAALTTTLEAHRATSVLAARSFLGQRSGLETADEIRRSADDRLFQNDPESWNNAEQNYNDAKRSYQEIIEFAEHREEAYQLCDEVDATLPYLLEWAVSVPATRVLEGTQTDTLLTDLADLAKSSRELRQLLDEGELLAEEVNLTGEDSGSLKLLAESYNKIRGAAERDAEKFSQELKDDLEDAATASALLHLPFLSGQTRHDVESRRKEILATYRKIFASHDEDTSADTLEFNRENPRALGTVFSIDPGENDASRNLLKEEQAIREMLRNIAASASQLALDDDESAENFFSEQSAPIRQTTAWIRLRGSGNQFALRHQRFLATRELLSESARTLQDFWGPTSTRSQVFSLEAAATLLHSSQQLFKIPRDQRYNSVDTLKQKRTALVERGLLVHTDPEIVFHPQAPIEIDLWLESPATENDQNLSWPTGAWTAFLARENGPAVSNTVLIPGDVPGRELSEASRPQLILAPPSGIQDDRYRGVYYFRGHRFETPLDLRFVRGPSVVRGLEEQSPTQLTVSGSYGGPITFLFVLDCSYSMQRTVTPNGRTRLQVAAETLYRVLNNLSGEEKIHVGVLFYGHRVGWNQRDPDELLYQQDWPGEIPSNLLPLEDVELVLSPGPVDDTALKQLTTRIANVRPWGETPLYLSLVQAAELVDPQAGAETHIVAITDGANNQRTPKALILSDVQKQQLKSRDEVVAKANAVNAKIDLLGFEMDPAENQAARAEFLDISSQTGGAYYPAVSADALIAVLQQILGPSNFSVSDSSVRTTDPVPFGQAVDLELSDTSPQNLIVRVDRTTEQVQVRGGERIRMYFDRKTSQLFVKPYLKELVVNAPLAARPDISLGFHCPRRVPDHEDRVLFRCSLNPKQGQYVPRPESVVVRATALQADGMESDLVWYVFNPLFAPEETVPVVEFVAENWPQDYSRAKVEIWVSWDAIEPDASRPLEKLLNSSESATLPMLDRPIFARQSPERNGTYYLIENFPENAAIENPFLMTIVSKNSTTPLRWRVLHRFDRIRGAHLQEMIPEHQGSEQPTDTEVELWSFEGIKKSSTTSEPALLEVLPAGTVLQPVNR